MYVITSLEVTKAKIKQKRLVDCTSRVQAGLKQGSSGLGK